MTYVSRETFIIHNHERRTSFFELIPLTLIFVSRGTMDISILSKITTAASEKQVNDKLVK